MRKTALLLVLLLLLPVFLCPASAELYLDQEPPAEWADRTDILRLTTFPTLINDCFLLEVGGKSMLIDGGVQKWGFKLSDALNELGFQHVDVIFNTHPHNDHLECVTWLLKKRLTADEFWSGLPETFRDDMQQAAVKQLQKSGIPYHQLSQYETVDFGGATLVFYWWEDAFDLNARSVQLHITFGERTMLLSADIGGEAQQNLLKQVPPELLKADILKYPHHALTAARGDYMTAVSPEFVFITNRKINIPKVMEQLDYRHIPARFTTAGRMVIATDGSDWYIVQYIDKF